MPWTAPRTWTAGQLVTYDQLNTDIRDNINYLKNPPTQTAANFASAFTTTSTAFADVASMPAVTTESSSRLLITAYGSFYFDIAATAYFTILIDGTNYGNATLGMQDVTTNTDRMAFCISYLSDFLSAGAHTVKLQVRVSANTFNLVGYHMFVREIS